MKYPLTINYGNKQFGEFEWDTTDNSVGVLIDLLTKHDYIIAPAYKVYEDGRREITEFSIIPYGNYRLENDT